MLKKLYFVFLLCLVIIGCSIQNDPGNGGEQVKNIGNISIIVEEDLSRTLLPVLSMDVASFDIYGTGPNGASFEKLDIDVSITNVMIESLKFGVWRIVIKGKNDTGVIIGSGEGTVTVVTNQTVSVTISVNPLDGVGALDVTVNWKQQDTQNPTILSQLIPSVGTPKDLSFTIAGGNQGKCLKDGIETGYHTLTLQLKDNDFLCYGTAEVVRIVKGETTYGVFNFENINIGMGTIDINIDINMEDPIDVNILNKKEVIGVHESLTVTADVTEDVGNLLYAWYLNGEAKTFTGKSYTVTGLTEGFYNLSAVVFTVDGKRAGSASFDFVSRKKIASITMIPPGGNYTSPQYVELKSQTQNVTIRYTLDGSEPSETNGIIYSSPFLISQNTTLKAIGYKDGFISSPIATSYYNFITDYQFLNEKDITDELYGKNIIGTTKNKTFLFGGWYHDKSGYVKFRMNGVKYINNNFVLLNEIADPTQYSGAESTMPENFVNNSLNKAYVTIRKDNYEIILYEISISNTLSYQKKIVATDKGLNGRYYRVFYSKKTGYFYHQRGYTDTTEIFIHNDNGNKISSTTFAQFDYYPSFSTTTEIVELTPTLFMINSSSYYFIFGLDNNIIIYKQRSNANQFTSIKNAIQLGHYQVLANDLILIAEKDNDSNLVKLIKFDSNGNFTILQTIDMTGYELPITNSLPNDTYLLYYKKTDTELSHVVNIEYKNGEIIKNEYAISGIPATNRYYSVEKSIDKNNIFILSKKNFLGIISNIN